MRKGVRLCCLAVLAALAVSALGCATAELGGGDVLALEDAQRVKNDIPVPLGFKFDRGRSIIRKTPAMRFLLLHYKGAADLDDAVRFYRDYGMNKEGWKFNEQSSQKGTVLLFFTKGKEKSIIRISKGVFHVYVEVEVYPYEK